MALESTEKLLEVAFRIKEMREIKGLSLLAKAF